MKKIFLLTFFIVCTYYLHNSIAQNVTIDSLWFDRQKGTINTSVSGLKDNKNDIQLQLRSGQKVIDIDKKNISVITGQTYTQKTIIWDYKKQNNEFISGNYYAYTTVRPLALHTPVKNVSLSFIWPGLGGQNIRNSKYSWLKGLVGWGLIAAGSYYYINSNNQYNNYLTSHNKTQADAALSNYNSSFAYSMGCYGAAGAIWTIDLVTIFSKNNKAYRKAIEMDGAIYVPSKRNALNVISKETRLDTRPLYDIAIDNAEKPYFGNDWVKAKYYYEEALKYKPGDKFAQDRLNIMNDERYKGKRGLPPNLFAELSFSDDNGNGILEAMESAVLKITLSNKGEGYASDLVIHIIDNNPDAAIKISDVKLDVLRNGEKKTFEIPIKSGVDLKTGQHRFEINVSEKFGFDMDPAYLVLNTFAYNPPKIVLSGIEIIDRGEGTSAIKQDGAIQPGEKVKVKLVLQNIGQNPALNTEYSISTNSLNIYIDEGNGKIGTFNVAEVKEVSFFLTPNKRTAGLDTLPVFLSIKESLGVGSYKNMQLPIVLEQKPSKPNIVNVQPDIASLQRSVAKFEYKSQKFTVNLGEINDIRKVPESKSVRKNAIAVVIGIEKYQNLQPAPYAANDAELMEEYFKKRLGINNVILLRNEDVTSTRLRKIFNPEWGELQRSVVKGETDVFVFYSGHGMPNKDGSKIYLFPNDGVREGIEDFGYDIEKLYEDLNKIEARSTTVILDACFSGSSRSSEKLLAENITGFKGVKIKAKNGFVNYPNFTIITSSTGEETSLGLDASESGLFTYYFCNGLLGSADTNGDHKITLGELKNYVIENVKKASIKISGLQTPQFIGDENKVLVEY